jgi:hypothetical protein
MVADRSGVVRADEAEKPSPREGHPAPARLHVGQLRRIPRVKEPDRKAADLVQDRGSHREVAADVRRNVVAREPQERPHVGELHVDLLCEQPLDCGQARSFGVLRWELAFVEWFR